eukprot:12838739-Ditylum_brightwellii.AAC.1
MSIVLCSRADGAYCYPGNGKNVYDEHGAIPPYVIQANKSKVKKDHKSKSSTYDKDETSANYIQTTPKGSMQQDLFLDNAKHLIKYLPPDQGKGNTCYSYLR